MKKRKKKTKIKINILRVLSWSFFFFFIASAIFIFASISKISNYKILSVQSGSMSPTINRGSIVVIKHSQDFAVGDIVTIKDKKNPDLSFTHRIFEIKTEKENKYYITKGDANNSPDTEKTQASEIIGKLIISIPLIGYPIAFAKTKMGFIFIIALPVVIIIYSEILALKTEMLKFLKLRNRKKKYAKKKSK